MDFEEMLARKSNKETIELPTRKAFDTRGIIADLITMEGQANRFVAEVETLEIKTEEDNASAVTISGKLQKLSKSVETKAKQFTEPYREVVSEVNGKRKMILDRIKEAKDILNQKIVQFKKRLELEKQKQQKKIEEATNKLQTELDEEAKRTGLKAPKVAPIKAPEPLRIARGKDGSSVYTRGKWICEIEHPGKVPRQYCVPSQRLLDQAVQMGVRQIEGCNIYYEEKPVTRSA